MIGNQPQSGNFSHGKRLYRMTKLVGRQPQKLCRHILPGHKHLFSGQRVFQGISRIPQGNSGDGLLPQPELNRDVFPTSHLAPESNPA